MAIKDTEIITIYTKISNKDRLGQDKYTKNIVGDYKAKVKVVVNDVTNANGKAVITTLVLLSIPLTDKTSKIDVTYKLTLDKVDYDIVSVDRLSKENRSKVNIKIRI